MLGGAALGLNASAVQVYRDGAALEDLTCQEAEVLGNKIREIEPMESAAVSRTFFFGAHFGNKISKEVARISPFVSCVT